jgi:hypothetical protein
MPVWERLAQVDALDASATAMALAGLRSEHPDATEQDLQAMLLARRRAAFGGRESQHQRKRL